MPDKVHLERGRKIGPPLKESKGKKKTSRSQFISGFSEAPAGSRHAGPSGPVTELGLPLYRTIGPSYFQSSTELGKGGDDLRAEPYGIDMH